MVAAMLPKKEDDSLLLSSVDVNSCETNKNKEFFFQFFSKLNKGLLYLTSIFQFFSKLNKGLLNLTSIFQFFSKLNKGLLNLTSIFQFFSKLNKGLLNLTFYLNFSILFKIKQGFTESDLYLLPVE